MTFADRIIITDKETGTEMTVGFNNAYGVRFILNSQEIVLDEDQTQELREALDSFMLLGLAGVDWGGQQQSGDTPATPVDQHKRDGT